MNPRVKISFLAVFAVMLIATFLFIKLGSNWGYVLPRRGTKILAIVLTGTAIGFSTVIFQTITNNRILTPSILGIDSLYMLVQTFVIFLFGSMSFAITSKEFNFLLSVGIMVLFTGLLFKLLFQGGGKNLYLLLLIGVVFGTLFQSLTTFMQVLIDPNEFLVVQDRMFASFNNVNTDILTLAIAGLVLATLYFIRLYKYLDVLSLGREAAINLGVDYDYVVKRLLVIIAILTSISTALVGPITFLGLLVVNVAHEFLKSYQHKYLIIGSVLIAIVALVGGQLIVERVFTFSTTLSVIINFIGGIYFIYLLLRENKSW
ncbi:iron chelate uptake ABC transporter family permease subunit [Ammoniphilus sp. YIM 78166]|uniref:iron chelate uptake ABC transporter family permease subunit n=1 Tax=Ammoniphilus sp. YIM 78166 TaxID=1644106 RepID=UPI00106F35CD|nr:iron chelate uptake ABC transporter family permease subunit [Ammoniphilus sp. YIM 78166]